MRSRQRMTTTTTTLPECYGREWATKSDPTCAKCKLEPQCGPLFASKRLLEVAEKLGMQVPRPSEAERLAKECGTTPEAILAAIDHLAKRAEKSREWSPSLVKLPSVTTTPTAAEPPPPQPAPIPTIEAKKRGRPKGSKNKPKPSPTNATELEQLAPSKDEDDDFPTVDVKVIEGNEIGALVASLSPEEAAEVVAVQEPGSEARAAGEAALAGRYSIGTSSLDSDERRAADRGWVSGRGHVLNLTTGAMEIVDWPGFPAVLRRPDSLAPVLQLTFWSPPLGKWVWLVDSPSGRQIPEGVVELTWRDLTDAGFAQRLRKETPEDSIRAAAAAAATRA